MTTPFTDIVMPVHGALEYLATCIESLEKHTQNFRMIFVDDCSPDSATSEFLDKLVKARKDWLLVRTGKQRWFTRAVNIGLRLVRQPEALVLNSDCVVDSGWLDELYSVWQAALADGDGPVGLVGSTLSGEEPRRWAATTEPNYVTGHCLLMAMYALDQVADKRGTPGWYLDETRQDHIHINSDRFLCYDMNRLGLRTVASFKSAVGHHFGKSWGCDLGRVSRITLADVD